MTPFPHRYVLECAALDGGAVLSGAGVPRLSTAPPVEFGGPGRTWSPEHMLLGAVESCFVFTFRALAQASGLAYDDLQVSGEGVVDRAERVTRFTEISLRARLRVPAGVDRDRALRLMESAERQCLVTASLSTPVRLDAGVDESPDTAVAALSVC